MNEDAYETFQISIKCPHCEDIHKYLVTLKPADAESSSSNYKSVIFSCPGTGKELEASIHLEGLDVIWVRNVGPYQDLSPYPVLRPPEGSHFIGTHLTARDRFLYQLGREMFAKSHDELRDYCRQMIMVSSGLFPVLAGLFVIILQQKLALLQLNNTVGWALFLTENSFPMAILMFSLVLLVFGVIFFVLGLSQTSEPINYFMVDDVSRYVIERYKSIRRDVLVGTAFFVLSLLSYLWALQSVIASSP